MERASSMISLTGAVSSSMETWPRGVMTSEAVSSEKRRVRSRKRATAESRVPSLAERRTIEESSSGVRAAESSSLASMPKRPRIQFAEPFMMRTSGEIMRVKFSWKGARRRATL